MRPTSAQIDAGIVDAAARLFAVQGVERTSLQQVADETGYSKTGLLHRFGSKDRLLEAVVDDCVTAMTELLEAFEPLPGGPDGLRSRLRLVVDASLAHPGLLQLLMVVKHPSGTGAPLERLSADVERFVGLLGLFGPSAESALRQRLALHLVVSAVIDEHTGVPSGLGDGLAPLLTDLAHRVAADPR